VFFYNGTTFADRFLFLPSLGFIAAAVLLMQRALVSGDQQPPQALGMPAKGAIAFALLLCMGASMTRAADWKDDFAVFSSGVAHAPLSSRTQAGLGTMYMNLAEAERDPAQRGRYVDSAVTHLEESIRLLPGNTNALFKVGLIYSMTGETNKAIDRYRRSIASRPDYVMALNNLGALYASLSLPDSAYVYFKQSYRADSSNGMTLTNLCIVSNLLGKRDEALKVAEYAERIGQGNEKTRGIRDAILQSIAR
jgi:tetratricopeptide (TPR) repeat protein